jgi:hypothetical protein
LYVNNTPNIKSQPMLHKEVIQSLHELFSSKTYHADKIEITLPKQTGGYAPDVIIKAGNTNIAAIEIKTSNALKREARRFNNDYYFQFKVRFFVYTDGQEFIIFDRFQNTKTGKQADLKRFSDIITESLSTDTTDKIKKDVIDIFLDEATKKQDSLPQIKQLIINNKNRIYDELKISNDYKLYFEGGKTDLNSFENQFFINLLDNKVTGKFYRYCSFERIFEDLNNKTIAMLGLPGMNDTTEPNYIDNYLNDTNDHFWELPHQTIEAINRRFILSCTTLRDNLLQWRLYGDNAKGACIEFKVKSKLKEKERFYLGKIKYANSNDEHYELVFLKRIIDKIKRQLGLELRFVLLYVWRHFFKPKEYEHEKEVRLLYLPKQGTVARNWILAEPYAIVNPMVLFNIDEFPLEITEIILGHKSAERELNKVQLKQMLNDKGLSGIVINESTTKVYR